MNKEELAKIYVVELLEDIPKDNYCHNKYKKGRLLCGIILDKARFFWVSNTHNNIALSKVKILYEYTGIPIQEGE